MSVETLTLATQLAILAEWDEARDCRTVNHPWKRIRIDRNHPEGSMWYLYCPQCGSELDKLYERFTYKVRRKYRYSEGYLLTRTSPNDDMPTRAELTRMLRQITEDIAERSEAKQAQRERQTAA